MCPVAFQRDVLRYRGTPEPLGNVYTRSHVRTTLGISEVGKTCWLDLLLDVVCAENSASSWSWSLGFV